MTESELKNSLEAAEKSPKQVAAAVSGSPEKVLRYNDSGRVVHPGDSWSPRRRMPTGFARCSPTTSR